MLVLDVATFAKCDWFTEKPRDVAPCYGVGGNYGNQKSIKSKFCLC